MSSTTVRLRPEVEQNLEDMAASSRRSKSWLINEALSEYIQHQKTRQSRWEQTVQAMESVANGQVVSAEAVHSWLNRWGTPEEGQPPAVGE